MPHLTPAAHKALRRQHGVVSLVQLLDAGLTRRAVRHLVQLGDLVPGLRGVYRSPSAPIDELSRCAEVSLGRSASTVAGPTAGRLWGLRHVASDRRVHVIVPPAANPAIAPWVVPYRTAAIDGERDVVQRHDGIRVTSPARTALDLARHLSPSALLSVIEQVIAQHRVPEDELRGTAAAWLSPGRPFVERFLRQLDRRLPGGAAESHPEIRVANGLRRRGVRHLVRQHDVSLPGYGRARFDLAVPALRWAVEVDVFPTHAETNGIRADELRDDAAEAEGWTVSRIDADEYAHHLDRRLDELAHSYRITAAMSGRPHNPAGGSSDGHSVGDR